MRLILKKIFDLQFFLFNVFVPLIALVLYCGSFAYISSRLMLDGVNYYFASKLLKYLLFILTAAGVVVLAIIYIQSRRNEIPRFVRDKFYSGDLLLILLPLTPIIQYILNNQDILSNADSLKVLVYCTFFFGLLIFAIPLLVGMLWPFRGLMIMGLAFVFTIASMASISKYFGWFEVGALRKQLPVLVGLFAVVWLLYSLDQRKILYLFIVVNLLANSFTQTLSNDDADLKNLDIEDNRLLMLAGEKKPVDKPGIYLLVYDAYVPNETMMGYGIDNSAQEAFLADVGFTLYPHTYSVAPSTLATMSRVLNAASTYYGDKRRAVSGNGTVQKLLKSMDYDTYGLFYSDYMFRGYGDSYDFSTPDTVLSPSMQLLKAILMGEFRFDIEKVGFGSQEHDEFVQMKQEILPDISAGKVFVYMHTDRPAHSQNAGFCLANETELFQDRLQEANLEMRADIELITKNDPDAIVIIAGDHGPFLTKNCGWTSGDYDISEISRLDIQDRYGTFLAIRWPTGDYETYDEITVLQDLFPAIFAYLYKDPTLLMSKIEPVIQSSDVISGVTIKDGMIYGGINDEEPLFLADR